MSDPEESTTPQRTSDGAPDRPQRRQTKLIKPGVQLRLAGIFAGLTVLCLLLQWLLFLSLVTGAANRMPVGSEYLLELVPELLTRALLLSAVIAFPLTLLIGIRATFGITGPIHRFETYLREVLRGTQLGPCKIRKGDSFGELCGLINEATEPVRRRALGPVEPSSEGEVA